MVVKKKKQATKAPAKGIVEASVEDAEFRAEHSASGMRTHSRAVADFARLQECLDEIGSEIADIVNEALADVYDDVDLEWTYYQALTNTAEAVK